MRQCGGSGSMKTEEGVIAEKVWVIVLKWSVLSIQLTVIFKLAVKWFDKKKSVLYLCLYEAHNIQQNVLCTYASVKHLIFSNVFGLLDWVHLNHWDNDWKSEYTSVRLASGVKWTPANTAAKMHQKHFFVHQEPVITFIVCSLMNQVLLKSNII